MNFKSIHKVHHEFRDRFGCSQTWWKQKWGQDAKWRLMREVEKWAKNYPEDVFVRSVDDAAHSGSNIIFILHRNEEGENWGTTVVLITQCDGQIPTEFFLYPGHLRGILEVLGMINNIEEIHVE